MKFLEQFYLLFPMVSVSCKMFSEDEVGGTEEPAPDGENNSPESEEVTEQKPSKDIEQLKGENRRKKVCYFVLTVFFENFVIHRLSFKSALGHNK